MSRAWYPPYLLAGMSLFGAALIARNSFGEGRNADEIWFQVSNWALVLTILAMGLGRGTRLGAYPTSGCLRVRNLIRTVDIGWGEIERFTLGQHLGNPRTGQVVLKSEKTVPIAGITANIF